MPSAANLRCVAAKKRKARAEKTILLEFYAEPHPVFVLRLYTAHSNFAEPDACTIFA